MASEVDICNLALGHLGDNATVASLDPPEGSAQAEHCARFYDIARDTLLEAHSWNFATKRVQLAELTSESEQWDYSYAKPSDCITAISVMAADAPDDYLAVTSAVPVAFVMEASEDGTEIILTDLEDAYLRYVARITDTTKFSAMFVMALSWQLASLLAGPVIKGDAGAAEAKRCAQMAMAWLSKAMSADANQRNMKPTHTATWIANR